MEQPLMIYRMITFLQDNGTQGLPLEGLEVLRGIEKNCNGMSTAFGCQAAPAKQKHGIMRVVNRQPNPETQALLK